MSTTDNQRYELTVIIAEEIAVANLGDIFKHLDPKQFPTVEFILCSEKDLSSLSCVPEVSNVRFIQSAPGARIPLLWRDGICAAESDWVALSTAHCIPSITWVKQLLAYDLSKDRVAVGGAIANVASSDAIGRAIYLLRYVNYTEAKSSGQVDDLAADNALYRKADIMAHDDLLDIGFWEPSFHERFIKSGLTMQFDSELLVFHQNRYSVRQFMKQRFDHGIEFGMERAKTMSLAKRMMMILLAPVIPFVFLRKILRTAKKDPQFDNGRSRYFGWVLVFLVSWSLGEVIGYGKVVQGNKATQ